MNHHKLKIWPEHYENVKAGTKTFEIRVNDRGFQKGDIVSLFYFDISDAKLRSTRGYETPIDYWTKPRSAFDHSVCKDTTAKPQLNFKIGDVYPVDAARVVFSLLKIEE